MSAEQYQAYGPYPAHCTIEEGIGVGYWEGNVYHMPVRELNHRVIMAEQRLNDDMVTSLHLGDIVDFNSPAPEDVDYGK